MNIVIYCGVQPSNDGTYQQLRRNASHTGDGIIHGDKCTFPMEFQYLDQQLMCK